MGLCSKIDFDADLQVTHLRTKLNSHGKAPCTREQLYTGVVIHACVGTPGKGQVLLAPVGLPAPGRTILALAEALARCKRPFSEDPLENVLGGLAWEHISYWDGPAGGRASSSPAALNQTHNSVTRKPCYRALSILEEFGML